MRRFKSVYIAIPLIILVFFAGVQPAYALDWGDVLGGIGILAGGAACIASVGLGCLVAAGAAFISGLASDYVLEPIVSQLVNVVADLITSVIQVVADVLFGIAAAFIHQAIHVNSLVGESIIAQEGFNIVLDIANLGLVVAIIVGAFMVMLRRTGATKILIRFLAVALFINFSFYIVINMFIIPVDEITAVLVNATNFDSNSFGAIFKPNIDWGETITNTINEGLEAEGITPPAEPTFVASITIRILAVIFYAAFVLLGVFSLFAFGIMLLIRYVAMIFLIILMPIALLAWIFPGIKLPGGHPTTQWVGQFSRWLLFAPVAAFFFFLSVRLTTVENLNALVESAASTTEKVFIASANMFVVVGFMIGGLIVANKMSITGSKYAMAVAKKGGKWARGRLAEKTWVAGTYLMRRGARREREAAERGEHRPSLTTRLQKFGSDRGIIAKTTSAPARWAGNALATARIRGEKAHGDAKKRLSELSIEEVAKRMGSASGAEQLAGMQIIFDEIKNAEKSIRSIEKKIIKGEASQEDLNKANAKLDKLIKIRDGLPARIRDKFKPLQGLYGTTELRSGGKTVEQLLGVMREEVKEEEGVAQPTPQTQPETESIS